MHCPILIRDDEFCLLENCRYYDTENGKCVYTGTGSSENETGEPLSVKGPEKDEVSYDETEDPVPGPGMKMKDLPYNGSTEEQVLKEEAEPERAVNGDEKERGVGQKMEMDFEVSAKQIWDRLKTCSETLDMPDYEEIVGSLIKVVNGTDGIHYLTPKSAGFWYRSINGLAKYKSELQRIFQ